MKILNYDNWKLWTQQLLDWLENQFAAVASSIDFTTVNNKIDAVGGKVDTVDGKVGDLTDIIEAINGDTVDDIVNGYLDGEAEEIMSIIGDWSEQESES